MRATWIVLGLVVGLGGVAYAKLRSKADSAALARAASPGGEERPPAASPATPPSNRTAVPAATKTPVSEAEVKAADLVKKAEERLMARDEAAVRALETELDGRYGDTDEARRYAFRRGWEERRAAAGRPPAERIPLLDRARRDLSRGLYLPEMFDASGAPTEARGQALAAIFEMNAHVYGQRAALAGVSETYAVRRGDSPLKIVDSREKQRPYGPNVVLFWNYGPELDPKRIVAGDTLALPLEPLSIHVSLAHRFLDLVVGGVVVKEFAVGVGKPETPTPQGEYVVKDKYRNPDWHSPKGVIRYGDPKNELGDAWIEISSPEHPKGYGIHGTNRPDTVGTECSNGCVRLANAQAVELLGWVRTGRNGPATVVVIR